MAPAAVRGSPLRPPVPEEAGAGPCGTAGGQGGGPREAPVWRRTRVPGVCSRGWRGLRGSRSPRCLFRCAAGGSRRWNPLPPPAPLPRTPWRGGASAARPGPCPPRSCAPPGPGGSGRGPACVSGCSGVARRAPIAGCGDARGAAQLLCRFLSPVPPPVPSPGNGLRFNPRRAVSVDLPDQAHASSVAAACASSAHRPMACSYRTGGCG